MKLDSEIKLRITSDEKKLIKDISNKYRVSMSEMIRKQIFSDMEEMNQRSKLSDEEFYKVVFWLRKVHNSLGRIERQVQGVAVNVNQIARVANSESDFSDDDLLYAELEKLGSYFDNIKQLSGTTWKGSFDYDDNED